MSGSHEPVYVAYPHRVSGASVTASGAVKLNVGIFHTVRCSCGFVAQSGEDADDAIADHIAIVRLAESVGK